MTLSGRVRSGWVGSGQVGSGQVRLGRVRSGQGMAHYMALERAMLVFNTKATETERLGVTCRRQNCLCCFV